MANTKNAGRGIAYILYKETYIEMYGEFSSTSSGAAVPDVDKAMMTYMPSQQRTPHSGPHWHKVYTFC